MDIIKAMVDTGNTTPYGAVLAKDTADQLGLKYDCWTKKNSTIKTAAQGGRLRIAGVSENVLIKLQGNLLFNIKKVLILDNLSGVMNLGSHFLERIKSTLDYSGDKTTLKIQDIEVPLIQAISEDSKKFEPLDGHTTIIDEPMPMERHGPEPMEWHVPEPMEWHDPEPMEWLKNGMEWNGSWPRKDLVPGPGQAEHGQKLESSSIATPAPKISVLKTRNQELISNIDGEFSNDDFNDFSNVDFNSGLIINKDSPPFEKSIFCTLEEKVAVESWKQPDPKEVLFSNKNNNFHLIKKKLRLSVPSSKFVSGSSRGVVRLNSLTQDGANRASCQAEIKESHVVPAQTVCQIQCQLELGQVNRAVLIEDVVLDSDGDLRVPEAVVARKPGGVAKVWVANTSDFPIGVRAGTKLRYTPLKNSCLRLPKNHLNQEPSLMSFKETEDRKEIDPKDLEAVEEKDPEFKKIWESLGMDKNELLNKNPMIRKQVKELIYNYQDIFSTSAPGETDLIELSLKLKEGTEPIRQKVRPLNPAMEKNLEEQIDQWLAQGVIEPSSSPWSSPLVPVKKKDGTVRWAVDFRRVNNCLEQDSYPLPRIQQLLEKAGGHMVYSALDATQAYFNVRISEKSRQVTAFATPNGLYQFCRMPFGLSVSVAVYSRFIAAALNKLGTKNLNSYLDDVLVFNHALQKHVYKLKDVFQAHREAGVKLKPAKTLLFREQVEYLGHTLSKEGIGMVDAYVARIQDWPVPTSVKELNTLLGFFSYYRNFIPDFATLTASMCKQRREKVLNWTPEMSENLDLLKAEFKKAPIRAAPKFDSEEIFQLTTDYSSIAIGAVLSQVQDGKERLIAAVGRKCTDPEKRYPSWKGELSAIMYGIRKFAPILSYKRFRINTDSSALKQLKSLKQNTGMLARWMEELAGYDFEVKHRPGKENLNADALSRREGMPEPEAEEHEEHSTYVSAIDQPGPATYVMELERTQILRSQAADPLLKQVREWVCAGKPPDKIEARGMSPGAQQYIRNFATLDIAEDGVLVMKTDTFMGPRTRILVPDRLKEAVFLLSHKHQTAGHFGMTATIARMKKHWWFPGLATDVQVRVGVCHHCLAKVVKEKQKSGIHVPQVNGYPMQTVFIDLVGPLPESAKGNRYIMSVMDGFSRFVSLYPIPSKHAIGVAQVLVDDFIKTFGCPCRVHSDNGLEFNNEMMKEVNRRLEIVHTRTPVYNPASNPVERFHRTLNQLLRVVTDREDKNWELHLPAITLAYNTKVNNSTGVTPSLAFLGREAKLPVDLVLQLPDAEYETPNHGIKDMLDRYNNIYQYVCAQQAGVIRRNAQQYVGLAKFKPGDHVWYFTTRGVPGKPAKHTNHWTGAWVVEKQVNEVLYRIRPWMANSKHKPLVVNISKLKLMRTPPSQHQLPKDIHLDAEDDDDTEELTVDRRIAPELGVPVYVPQRPPEVQDVVRPASPPRLRADVAEEPLPVAPNPGAQVAPGAPMELPDELDRDEIMLEPDEPGPSGVNRKRGRDRSHNRRESRPRQTPIKRKSNDNEEWEVYTPVVKQRPGIMEKLSQGMTKFATEVRDYAAAAQDTALPDSDEEMGEPPSLNSLCTLMERGASMPHRLIKPRGGYAVHAPSRLKLLPGRVTAVSLGWKLDLPEQTALKLVVAPRLTGQGVSLQGHCQSKIGTVSVLLYNNQSKPVIIERSQQYCRASLLQYEAATTV